MCELQKKINAMLVQIKSLQNNKQQSNAKVENANVSIKENGENALTIKTKEINLKSVETAYQILNGEKLATAEHCFKYFASINLLNAYVKKDYANATIKNDYSFKKFVVKALTNLSKFCPNGVNFGKSESDKVVYLQVYNMQFSFHSCLPKNSNLTLKEMQWQNVRLQPFAQEIFDLALQF